MLVGLAVLVQGPRPAAADGGGRLTLEQALAAARRSHPALRARRAQADAAHAQVGVARSGYLPHLDASFQYGRATPNWLPVPPAPALPSPGGGSSGNQLRPSDTVGYTTFGAVLSQQLYDFGRTRAQLARARAGEELSDANMALAQQDVETGLRIAYYGVLAAQQAVEVAEQARGCRVRQLHLTEQAVTAGTRTHFDTLSAQLALQQARLGVVHANGVLRAARARLLQAMGVEASDGNADFEVVEPEQAQDSALEQQSVRELLAIALENRPELAQSAAQVAARRADHAAARAGYLPDLVASGSFTGANVDGSHTGLNWYVGLGLRWRAFDGLASYHRTHATAALEQASEANVDQTRQAIATNIAVRLANVEEVRARLDVAQQAAVTAAERRRLSEDRYRAGVGTIIELDDAQAGDTSAQLQVVQTRFGLSAARVLLARSVGR